MIDTTIFGRRIRYPAKINVPANFGSIEDTSGFLVFKDVASSNGFGEAPWRIDGITFWPEEGQPNIIGNPGHLAIPLTRGDLPRKLEIDWQSQGGRKNSIRAQVPASGNPPPRSYLVGCLAGEWSVSFQAMPAPFEGFQSTFRVTLYEEKPDRVYFIELQNLNTLAMKATKVKRGEPGYIFMDQFEMGENWEVWVHEARPVPMELTAVRLDWTSPSAYSLAFRDDEGNDVARATKYAGDPEIGGARLTDPRFMTLQVADSWVDLQYDQRGHPNATYSRSLPNLRNLKHGDKVNAVGYVRERHARSVIAPFTRPK